MRVLPTTAVLAASLAAAPLPAQDEPPPVLVETADEAAMRRALAWLGQDPELPPLEAGQHWRLELRQGESRVRAADGLIWFLLAEVRPGQGGGGLAAAGRRARGALRGALRALGAWGVTPEVGDRLEREAEDLLSQVEVIRLQMQSSPGARQRTRVQVWIEPAAGTWLAELVAALRPTRLGAPAIARGAPLSVAAEVDLDLVARAAQRPLALWAALTTDTEEAAVSRARALDSLREVLDGSFAWAWHADVGARLLTAGLDDPSRIRELYHSRTFLAGAPEGFELDAVELKGTMLHRSLGAAPPGGKAPVTLGGLAGSALVAATAEDEGAARQALERLAGAVDLAAAIRRQRLPDLAVAVVSLRPREVLAAAGLEAGAEGLPARVELTVGNTGDSLFFTLVAD